MKKNKQFNIEIIRRPTSDKKCYICKGLGKIKNNIQLCNTCKGTGIFKDNHYILITNGMAWPMDTIK